jgi:hypothetical protein
MDFVRNAWRLLDGSYRLKTQFPARQDNLPPGPVNFVRRYVDEFRARFLVGPSPGQRDYVAEIQSRIREAGGHWDEESGFWIVPESAVDLLGVERIFVVVVAGYCCRGPARAEARAYQVKRRAIFRVFCESCGKRPRDSTLWEVPIIESCGEGEEGQLTYETAFRDEIEGR